MQVMFHVLCSTLFNLYLKIAFFNFYVAQCTHIYVYTYMPNILQSLAFSFITLYLFLVLGIETEASHILGNCLTMALHPHPSQSFYHYVFVTVIKYADKSNLKEKIFILAHRSQNNPPW